MIYIYLRSHGQPENISASATEERNGGFPQFHHFCIDRHDAAYHAVPYR